MRWTGRAGGGQVGDKAALAQFSGQAGEVGERARCLRGGAFLPGTGGLGWVCQLGGWWGDALRASGLRARWPPVPRRRQPRRPARVLAASVPRRRQPPARTAANRPRPGCRIGLLIVYILSIILRMITSSEAS
jgi:hypothetical protein